MANMTFHPLSGDAGFRRYFRLGGDRSIIAVNSPPDKEKNLAYVRTSNLLRSLGVRVPKIYAVDFENGFFLLEDMGNKLLQAQVFEGCADGLYAKAADHLRAIQSCGEKPDYIPYYDRPYLLKEMELFPEWFLLRCLGLELDDAEKAMLQNVFSILMESAASQPQGLVHRDFHARNLMCLDSGDIAVIDFQDATWGPITYDYVSLARDCYLRWSIDRLDLFVEDSHKRLVKENKITVKDIDQFRRWFDLMGLQRHIKVLGVFARLSLRDNKHQYLRDFPLVLRYTIEVSRAYEELSDFNSWMLDIIVPRCQQKSWYSDWSTAGDNNALR